MGLGVDTQGHFTIAGSLSYHVSPGDEFFVTLVSAGIGLIGGAIFGAIGGPAGAAIGGAIGFVVGVVGTVIAFAIYTPSLSLPNCVFSDDKTSFSCSQKLPLPNNPLLGQLTVGSPEMPDGSCVKARFLSD